MWILYSIDYGDGYYGPSFPIKTPVAKFSTKALAQSYVEKARHPDKNKGQKFLRSSLLYGGYEIEEEKDLPIDPDPNWLTSQSEYIAVIKDIGNSLTREFRIVCKTRKEAEHELSKSACGGHIEIENL